MHNDSIKSKYHVIQVKKTTAPEGMPGQNWYLYIIQKGKLTNSVMECKKMGTLQSVTAHAKEAAKILNLRNVKGGRK
jgi:hypothetical protein